MESNIDEEEEDISPDIHHYLEENQYNSVSIDKKENPVPGLNFKQIELN